MNTIWMWGALGLILIGIEMATGTFYILWFGIAALCVSMALWLMPNLSTAMQIFIFAVLSFGSLTIWKLFYKKTETHSRVGQAQGEEIGRTGEVIVTVSASQQGTIRFTQGLMGSREWAAISNETIAAGAQATVVAVEGNALRITAL